MIDICQLQPRVQVLRNRSLCRAEIKNLNTMKCEKNHVRFSQDHEKLPCNTSVTSGQKTLAQHVINNSLWIFSDSTRLFKKASLSCIWMDCDLPPDPCGASKFYLFILGIDLTAKMVGLQCTSKNLSPNSECWSETTCIFLEDAFCSSFSSSQI